jgi:haloacid dehalogenase-like hydrolase/Cation transporting ATPase, C-terminus
MITGDHVTTAGATAGQLGIEGRALSGTEFAALSDAQLDAQVEDIGLVARVAPEDKVRLVEMLKQKGHVVAMTGDGVNDAPALLSLLVTTLSPLQRIFDTRALTAAQWGICLIGPLVYLALTELGKWFNRRTGEVHDAPAPVAT